MTTLIPQLKCNVLDDPRLVRRTRYQIWTDHAVPWAPIDADLPSFPRNRTVAETNNAQPADPGDKAIAANSR
ncbi:hypothetical protein [Scytonema sp. HK-05]|uniref:hypothetical protein n=1 Tax=Scytonema sp. HK-05 TaxID=1137095 RepID=UPI00130145A8